MTIKLLRTCGFGLVFGLIISVQCSAQTPKPPSGGSKVDAKLPREFALRMARGWLQTLEDIQTYRGKLGSEYSSEVPVPPQEDEFVSSVRHALLHWIKIVKSRKYISMRIYWKTLGDLGRSNGKEGIEKVLEYFGLMQELNNISNESHYTKESAAVAQKSLKELTIRYGEDPTKYYLGLAVTFRPKAVWPPYRIGKVTVEGKERNDRWTDAGRNLVDARNTLHGALKFFKERQSEYKVQELKYWQTYEDQQVRLRPLRRAYEAAIAPAVNVEKARVVGMNGHAEIERQKIRKRIDQIDRHLPLLDSTFTGPNAAQYAAERRKALLTERAELQAKLVAISGQTKAKTGPQLRADLPDAKQLYEKWQSEKRLSDIRMAQVGRDLDVAARHRDQDENAVTKAEVALGKATKAWSTAQRDQTVRLEQISSDDFRAKFISGLPDIGKLNRLIDHARFNLRIAESAHAVRRRDLVKWGDILTRDSESLARSGYESAVAQASVEAAEQMKSFVGKLEDPPAAFADAAVNIFWNIATPPTIYDAETGPLPHSRKDIAAFAAGEAEGMGKTAINKARSSVRATIAHTREVTIPQLLAEQTARIEAGDFSGLSTVEDALSHQQAQLERIQKDFAAKVLKKGAGAFVKKMGGEVLESLGKSIIKAEIKKGIAEFVEGPALYKYAEDQMELMLAGRRLAMARTVADQLRGQLVQLQKQRDALLDKYARYDASTGSLVEQNRQFLAQAGYAFYLYPKDDGKSAGKDSALSQLKARVFLQGIELKQGPSPRGLKFTIRSEDETKFNTPTLPEKLAMTIKLQ